MKAYMVLATKKHGGLSILPSRTSIPREELVNASYLGMDHFVCWRRPRTWSGKHTQWFRVMVPDNDVVKATVKRIWSKSVLVMGPAIGMPPNEIKRPVFPKPSVKREKIGPKESYQKKKPVRGGWSFRTWRDAIIFEQACQGMSVTNSRRARGDQVPSWVEAEPRPGLDLAQEATTFSAAPVEANYDTPAGVATYMVEQREGELPRGWEWHTLNGELARECT